MRRLASINDASSNSASSNGSTFQPLLSTTKTEPDDTDDINRSIPPILTSIFGVLFTLSKEKNEEHIRIDWFLIKCFVDYWQLFATVVSPSMGWKISINGRLWWWLSLPNFNFLQDLNFRVYVGLLYAMVALLLLNIFLSVYVAYGFHRRHFPYVWPVKVQRVFSSIFFQIFDLSSLNLLQVAFSCQFTGAPEGQAGYLQLFPTQSCLKLPYLVHAIVGLATILVFMAIALFLNLAEVEVNIYSKLPNALGNSGPEVMGFALKALLTSVNVFIGQRRIVSIMYVLIAAYLVWVYFRWSPHFLGWANHIKVGIASSIFYVTLVLNIMVYNPGVRDHETARVERYQQNMTYIMVAGLVPSGLLGAYLSHVRLCRFHKRVQEAFLRASIDSKPKEIFRFLYPEDVEIACRLGRVWVSEDEIEKDALTLTGNIIKVGIAQMPNNPFLMMLQANFLMEGPGFFQAAQRQIHSASKMDPNIMVRFMLFVREQLATQQAAGRSGAMGSQMDLVGYVEYQRKYALVIRVHKEALMSTSHFWQQLQSHHISFKGLAKSLIDIEKSTRKAELSYRMVLSEYSNNTKLLRLYARFLDTVKNDSQAAARFYSEATKLDELHGDTDINEEMGGIFGPLNDISANVEKYFPEGTISGDENGMIIVANAAGIIQLTNKPTSMLLGYKRGDLEGKNIKGLMPQPWSSKHVTYLKNYLQRGDDRVTTPTLHLVMLHHLGFGIPVNMNIAKTTGLGEDSIFMGYFKRLRCSPGLCRLWVLPNGVVTCADYEFCASFGYHPNEIAGTRLSRYIHREFPNMTDDAAETRRHDIMRNLGLSNSTVAPNRDVTFLEKCIHWYLANETTRIAPDKCAKACVGQGCLRNTTSNINSTNNYPGGSNNANNAISTSNNNGNTYSTAQSPAPVSPLPLYRTMGSPMNGISKDSHTSNLELLSASNPSMRVPSMTSQSLRNAFGNGKGAAGEMADTVLKFVRMGSKPSQSLLGDNAGASKVHPYPNGPIGGIVNNFSNSIPMAAINSTSESSAMIASPKNSNNNIANISNGNINNNNNNNNNNNSNININANSGMSFGAPSRSSFSIVPSAQAPSIANSGGTSLGVGSIGLLNTGADDLSSVPKPEIELQIRSDGMPNSKMSPVLPSTSRYDNADYILNSPPGVMFATTTEPNGNRIIATSSYPPQHQSSGKLPTFRGSHLGEYSDVGEGASEAFRGTASSETPNMGPNNNDFNFESFAPHGEMVFKHKYLSLTTCLVKSLEIGSVNAKLVEFQIRPQYPDGYRLTMICDSKGQLRYMTSDMAYTLGVCDQLPSFMAHQQYANPEDTGFEASEREPDPSKEFRPSNERLDGFVSFKLSNFLPMPWGALHMKWLKDASESKILPSINPLRTCRGGVKSTGAGSVLTVCNQKGVPIPMRVNVSSIDCNGERLHVVNGNWSSFKEGMASRRICMSLSNTGEVLSVAPGTPKELFGFIPEDLVGSNIISFVDFGTEETSLNPIDVANVGVTYNGNALMRVNSSSGLQNRLMVRNDSCQVLSQQDNNSPSIPLDRNGFTAIRGSTGGDVYTSKLRPLSARIGNNTVNAVNPTPANTINATNATSIFLNNTNTTTFNAARVDANPDLGSGSVAAGGQNTPHCRGASGSGVTLHAIPNAVANDNVSVTAASVANEQRSNAFALGNGVGAVSRRHKQIRRIRAQMLYQAMIRRALHSPGCSWQVMVVPPGVLLDISDSIQDPALLVNLISRKSKAAILKLSVVPSEDNVNDIDITAEIWLTEMVSGVLEVDLKHFIVSRILEPELRPCSLFFAINDSHLQGSSLASLFDASMVPAVAKAQARGFLDKSDRLSSRQVYNIMSEGSLEARTKGVLKSGTFKQSYQVGQAVVLKANNNENQKQLAVKVQVISSTPQMAIIFIRPAEPLIPIRSPQPLYDLLLPSFSAPKKLINPITTQDQSHHQQPRDGSFRHPSNSGAIPTRIGLSKFAFHTNEERANGDALTVQNQRQRQVPGPAVLAGATTNSVAMDSIDGTMVSPRDSLVPRAGKTSLAKLSPSLPFSKEGTSPRIENGKAEWLDYKGSEAMKGVTDNGYSVKSSVVNANTKPRRIPDPSVAIPSNEDVHNNNNNNNSSSNNKTVAPGELKTGAPIEALHPDTPDLRVDGRLESIKMKDSSDEIPVEADQNIRISAVPTTIAAIPFKLNFDSKVDMVDKECEVETPSPFLNNQHINGVHEENRNRENEVDEVRRNIVKVSSKHASVSSWVASEGAYFETERTHRSTSSGEVLLFPLNNKGLNDLNHAAFPAPQIAKDCTVHSVNRAIDNGPSSIVKTSSSLLPKMSMTPSFMNITIAGDQSSDAVLTEGAGDSGSMPILYQVDSTEVTKENDTEIDETLFLLEEKEEEVDLNSRSRIASGASFTSQSEINSDNDDSVMSMISDQHSGRRFKRLLRLLNNPFAQKVIQRFKMYSLAMISFIIIVHACFFGVLVGTILVHMSDMNALNTYVLTLMYGYKCVFSICVLRNIQEGIVVNGAYNATFADVGVYMDDLNTNSLLFAYLVSDIFQASAKYGGQVSEMLNYDLQKTWDNTYLNGTAFFIEDTAMNVLSRFLAYTREIVASYGIWLETGALMADQLSYKYTTYNFFYSFGPVFKNVITALFYTSIPRTDRINKLHLAFLVLEGLIAVSVSIYVSVLLKQVLEHRYRIFETFTTIPIGLTRAIASKTLHLLDSNSDSDMNDEEEQADDLGMSLWNDNNDTDFIGGKKRSSVGFGFLGTSRLPSNSNLNKSFSRKHSGTAHRGSVSIKSGNYANGKEGDELEPKRRKHSSRNRKSPNQYHRNNSSNVEEPLSGKGRGSGGDEEAQNRRSATEVDTSPFSASPFLSHNEESRLSGTSGFSWILSKLANLWMSLTRFLRNLLGIPEKSKSSTMELPMSRIGSMTSNAMLSITDEPRRLKRDSNEMRFLILPIWAWALLVIIVYAIGYHLLVNSVQPLANQAVINYIPSLLVQCSLTFHELLSQMTSSGSLQWLESSYEAYLDLLSVDLYTMYGSKAPDVYPSTVLPMQFPLVSKAAIYDSPNSYDLYMNIHLKCIRPDQSTCLSQYDVYYAYAVGPLSMSISKFLYLMQDTMFFIYQNSSSMGLNSSVITFIFRIVMEELLLESLELQSAHASAMLSPFHSVIKLHIVVLIVGVLGFFLFLFINVIPLTSRIKKEKHQIAELLSQLPKELDMTKTVAVAIGIDESKQKSGETSRSDVSVDNRA